MDSAHGHGGHLSAVEAAALLGVSVRHVRRLIATGQIAGDTRPYRTRKEAVDTYRQRQQGLAGEVVNGTDHRDSSPVPRGHQTTTREPDTMAAAFTAALAELGRAREHVAALAREVGRLEAERAHGQQGQNGHRGGTLARLGPWLRR